MKEGVKKPQRLQNVITQAETFETLSSTATAFEAQCTRQMCNGSLMLPKKSTGKPRPKEEVLKGAKEFIDEYFTSSKSCNSEEHKKRWKEISAAVENTGTYHLTLEELTYGAKLAWRNAPRCIGRIQWTKLHLFDFRHVTTAAEMFEAICTHIEYAMNKGNIRSAITVFPARTDVKTDFRVWNPQLVAYAGYRQEDGSCIGDPINCEFTELCQKLGWQAPGGQWDILPMVLSANGQDPEVFDLPPDHIVRVPMSHPQYNWFAEMGLEWYALPAVSGMCFDCGGIEFPAAPFNGWYMGTEIAARDFCDPQRLNILEDVGRRMGLDTRNKSTLWKDKALIEVNVAVLHSFQIQNVTIVDHHTASETFMTHFENEQRSRGGCPADWVWIVPPVSGSLTPVFHQEMSLYHLKPSYEYQDPAWKTHIWKSKDFIEVTTKKGRNIKLKELTGAVIFMGSLYRQALSKRIKATILYATETGKSETYAKKIKDIFNHSFYAQVHCMADYNHNYIENETLVLVVTSTFGNGDPPENGEKFSKNLKAMKALSNAAATNNAGKVGPLRNVRYAVFALGSSAYPHFCAFGKNVNTLFADLGGQRLMDVTCGDELAGQEETFKQWSSEVFKVTCDTFFEADDAAEQVATQVLETKTNTGCLKLQKVRRSVEIAKGLSHMHNKKISTCQLLSARNIHGAKSSRSTLQVILNIENIPELSYQAGDHVAIIPANHSTIVDAVLPRLTGCTCNELHLMDLPWKLMVEVTTSIGNTWEPHETLPIASIREMLTRYLDITTPPTPTFLKMLAKYAHETADETQLNLLATDSNAYAKWRHWNYPNLKEVFEQFPSIIIDTCVLLTHLPVLQWRFYSISSSPDTHPGQIHLTVGVLKYRTQGNKGPMHQGICSNFLKNVKPGGDIECFVRSASSFHMPTDLGVPIIMVGSGTGVAPFRSFWQQRHYDTINRKDAAAGEMTLFFGCQTKSSDLYAEEKEAMKKAGVLSNNHLALSRDPNTPKTYVQDMMVKSGAKIYNQLAKEKGHFYVCGDNTKGEFASKKLKSIIQEHGNLSEAQVEDFMVKMKDENRYHEDLFGISLYTEKTPEPGQE